LTTERLREQLGRLGGTAFKCGELKNRLEGDVMLPVSELNRLRREAIGRLESLRAQPKRWTPSVLPASCRQIRSFGSDGTPGVRSAQLIVLVRNLAQLEAALRSGVQTLYCEFEDPKKYREAVGRFRQWQNSANTRSNVAGADSAFRTSHSELFVAPPRIFKMGEEWILKLVRSCEAD